MDYDEGMHPLMQWQNIFPGQRSEIQLFQIVHLLNYKNKLYTCVFTRPAFMTFSSLSLCVRLPRPKLLDHKLLKCNDLSPSLSLSSHTSSNTRLESLPHYPTGLSITLAYIWDLRHFLIFSSRTHLSWPSDELSNACLGVR